MAEANKSSTTTKSSEKTEANKRQDEAAKTQAEEQKAEARKAKAVDKGTLVVVLRDHSDQTAHDVEQLVASLGATVKSSSKGKVTVDLPDESERNTGSYRQKIVEHLDGSPLVEAIE